ncbi:hypothetical protein FH966_08190 [Lentibacillus cibarius]|uniref:Uncharacterized protein n=1 Tax=Lentibacillus cibarius TaxID=2583219 RepID=A0A549YIG3_9BACI|nr:hypothetical protein [Lentibacillus cibarius]TRM11663.1 hypothetical protein FH966_08190 [Lentibacillus cibarius]
MSNMQTILYNRRKKPIAMEPSRIALYRQCEVVEAISENNDMYYLFFYHYRFLTAAKASKLKRGSFIASTFQHGMVFDAPHPFIEYLITSNQPLHIKGFDTLIKDLDKRYSSLEKAFILTFFESFLSKKRLFEEIKSTFYAYRRKGQNFYGYQIIRILMDFAPGHSFVRQMSGDSIFRQYQDSYSRCDEAILSADPIFFEKIAFANMDSHTWFQKLITHLDQSSRWLDLLAIYCFRLINHPSIHVYEPFKEIAVSHLNAHQVMQLQEQLHQQSPPFAPLERDLLVQYAEVNHVKQVLMMLESLDIELYDEQKDTIRGLLLQLDPQSHSLSPELFPALTRAVTVFCPEQAHELLHTYIAALLADYEPGYIKSILEPFSEHRAIHPLYLKMDRMSQFSNDLEHMQALGELYEEFGRSHEAIACFSWEMELKPHDPEPVKRLSKIYKDAGNVQEAEAYRQLLKTM